MCNSNTGNGISWQICLLSLALCLSGGFQQGYVASVLNQPYVAIESFINASYVERTGDPTINTDLLYILWSTLNIAFPTATILGQLIAAYLCNRIGRRQTAIVACILYLPGIALSMATKWLYPAFELLFVGRLLWSMANGICVVNQTVWIVEAAPVKHRGRMAAMQEVFMAVGSLLTQAMGVLFSSVDNWPFIFVLPFVVSIIALVLFFCVHESPQFLLVHRNDPVKARKALAAYHGITDPIQLDDELKQCTESGKTTTPKTTIDNSSTNGIYIPKHVTSIDVMFNPCKANDPVSKVVRQAAWLGVMVKIAYVFTGARCIRAYTTFILHDMAKWTYVTASYGTLAIGLLRLPLTFVPVMIVDRVGRKPLLLMSTLISFAALSITMVSLDQGANFKIGSLMGITILLSVNAMGLGSVSRFYAAELVPRNLLLESVSILTIVEALLKIAVEFSFYPLANWIGSHSLMMFLGPTGAFILLIWYYCPETSGKSVNDVLNKIAKQRNIKVSFSV